MPGENPPGADGPAPIVFYGAANAICLSLVHRINAAVPTWEPVGWLDDDPGRQGSEFWGLPILGGGELLPELASRPGIHVFNNVRGHWSRNERVAERIDRAALPTASLIAAGTDTPRWAGIGAAPAVSVDFVYPEAF